MVLDETFDSDPEPGWIFVTVKSAESSASVSSFKTSSWIANLVTLESSSTLSVSSTATGVSLTPVTVIVNVAVSVAVPSETV